jgi:hypothetical protein
MSEHLRRALEALERGASEARVLSSRSAGELRGRLNRTVEEVLDHLEADTEEREAEPEDVMSRLDRQSKDIAEDLRRAERLMRQRMGQE